MSVFFDRAGFIKRLEALRRSAGLSKGAFAERVGVSQIFSRYAEAKPGQKERKVKAPSVETLLVIAHEFNTSVDWLLTGKEPAAPDLQLDATPDSAVPACLQDLLPRIAALDATGQNVIRTTLEGLLAGLSTQGVKAEAQPPPQGRSVGAGRAKAGKARG